VTSGELSQGAGDCTVVGIGASAGGVEALALLFASMPPSLGAAFVVVTHLGPNRESLLADIIARQTAMPVLSATDDAPLRANHVYVLPSDSVLTVANGRLQLKHARGAARERNPIDVFFASLARDRGERTIGIVLSGAGNDGTLGVKAIKEEGGLTIAQGHDGSGPAYESMPASAISSGLVDLVVPVEQIGAKLAQYERSMQVLDAQAQRLLRQDGSSEAMREVHTVLRKRVGHDFSGYKEKTFMRRVQRRMQVRQIDTLAEYLERLRHDPDEATLLFRDLLIGVTSFFRDRDAFEAVENLVLPKLFENVGAADIVRVWVPGCATGEEAYSIAILLRERLSQIDSVPRVQVFATDIDESALAIARAARYPAAMLANVAPERLKRHFRQDAESYVVAKEVRDLCIFSAHSVIRDPPFSRMDLVSCRNLLIYFNAELQDSVLPVFHYALKPGGYLFLGPSETVSRHGELFAPIEKKHRIFQRRPVLSGDVRIPSWVPKVTGARVAARGHIGIRKDQRLRQHVEASVLEHFAPAHTVIEADGNVLYYSSRTGKYLEPEVGSPSRQILAQARKGLRLELRAALREAVEKRAAVVRERVEVEIDDRVQVIRLTVQPLFDGEHDPLYLVVFNDLGPPVTHEQASLSRPSGDSGDVASLEEELRETRDRLQGTIEEYETALEELKSGNEELVSVNEELQSTNEEMETSKEELQSVNEELHTVNSALAAKVDELFRSNADLSNLFESTQIATVFLDKDLVIRSFTPAVTNIVNLIPSDRGRPITDIAHQLEEVDLGSEVRRVLQERRSHERPVRMRNGQVFHLMRVLPYRTVDEGIDGALITFVDITDILAAEEQQRTLVAELNHRVRNMLQVVIGLANQTLHRSADLKTFETSFMGRMQSLARAYELVSRGGWKKVPILDLLRTQLAPFAGERERERYNLEGEQILLNTNAALALGLVLYELATNAIKYGALSVSDGRVQIAWRLHDGDSGELMLSFRWEEHGGPRVAQPARRGFGSELLQRQLTYELKGQATMDFAEEGLKVLLEIPASGAVVA
jgi:two-component system, chemotaxis family, CheB/CheR fusion protein